MCNYGLWSRALDTLNYCIEERHRGSLVLSPTPTPHPTPLPLPSAVSFDVFFHLVCWCCVDGGGGRSKRWSLSRESLFCFTFCLLVLHGRKRTYWMLQSLDIENHLHNYWVSSPPPPHHSTHPPTPIELLMFYCIECFFYVNDEPESKFLYTETVKLYSARRFFLLHLSPPPLFFLFFFSFCRLSI